MKKIIIKIGLVVITLSACAAGMLVALHFFYLEKWHPQTTINGVDFSGKTLQDALDYFENSDYTLTVNEELVISASDICLANGATEAIQEAWVSQHKEYFSVSDDIEFSTLITFNEESIVQLLEESVLMSDDNITESQNAEIVWVNTHFEIQEEILGYELLEEVAIEYIKEAIYSGNTTLTLPEDAYKPAEITSEDLEEICFLANCYSLHWITWNIEDNTEALEPETIKDWINIESDTVTVDETAIEDWVEEICLSYKTLGRSHAFTTHDGESITVSGGDYGWRIDYEEMCEQAIALIESYNESAVQEYLSSNDNSGLNISSAVSFTSTAYQFGDIDYDPDNYIEIDIGDQMVFVYQDGELVYSSICITGLPDGDRDTPTGVWYLKDKQEEYYMSSTTYGYSNVYTRYWMRVTWTGEGMHWSNKDWDNWTNTSYYTIGSHGCINLPLESAKTIYGLVSVGDVVIIHD